MKIRFFVLAILAVFLVGTANLSAFCIYNHTDTLIIVDEISGGRVLSHFNEYINPGKKSCCNWKNKGCNKKHKRDSKLKFKVSVGVKTVNGDATAYGDICKNIIKAGGALVVTGKNGHYSCKVKGY